MIRLEVLLEMAYAASDLATGVRAAAVRRGAVEVAALVRGLSVRAKDAIVPVGVLCVIDAKCVCFERVSRVIIYRNMRAVVKEREYVGGRFVGRKGRLERPA